MLCCSTALAGERVAQGKTTQFKYNATGSLGSPWVGLVPYAPGDSAGSFPHSMENLLRAWQAAQVGKWWSGLGWEVEQLWFEAGENMVVA